MIALHFVLASWLWFVAISVIARLFGIEPVPVGHVLGLAASALAIWYLHDMCEPRETIYRRFGYPEAVLKPIRRHLRLIAMVGLALIGAGAVLVELLGLDDAARLDSAAAGPVALMVAAALATMGWIVTNYQNQKAMRISNSLQANRDVFHENRYATRRLQIAEAVAALRRKNPSRLSPERDAIPLDLMSAPFGSLLNAEDACDPKERKTPFLHIVTEWLNLLEQVAFGVRSGQIDYVTVEQTMRSTYLRSYAVFEEYIAESAGAETDSGREYRASEKAYEHFLWFVAALPKTQRRAPPRGWLAPPAAEGRWLALSVMALGVFEAGLLVFALLEAL